MGNAPVRKILITGPEATGKSWMAQQLASIYHTVWVPEYARDYLNGLSRPYRQEDLMTMLRGQLQAEQVRMAEAQQYLFCDTGPEVLYVWSQYKYGSIDAEIETALNTAKYALVLLMDTDLPWEPDPLRETPDPEERKRLLQTYRELLSEHGWPFQLISGTGPERLQNARSALENLF